MKNLNFSSLSIKRMSAVLLCPLFFALGCTDSGGGSLVNNPQNPLGEGPAPVNIISTGETLDPTDLSSTGNYAILAKSGVSTTGATAVTGHIGASPIASTGLTGFGMTYDAPNGRSTSASVVGGHFLYASDYTSPTPSNLTTAIGVVERAYTDAATRTDPDFVEFQAGDLSGQTLAPGLYKWSNTVTIPLDFTISGSATDVWIFQIAGDLTMSSNKQIILAGGALPENIFWAVAGEVVIGTGSDFYGIIMSKTAIVMQTGATLEGRAFAQTEVTLDASTVTQP